MKCSVLCAFALALSVSACGQQVPAAPTPNLEATVRTQVQSTVAALPTTMPLSTGEPTTTAPSPTTEPTATAMPSPFPMATGGVLSTVPSPPAPTINPTAVAFAKQIQPVGMLAMLDDYATFWRGGISALPGLWKGQQTSDGLSSIADLGFFSKAQEGHRYSPGEAILVGNTAIVGVVGYRLDADQFSLSQGQGYLVVDFAIINIAQRDYLSLASMFEITDLSMFTYSPTIFGRTAGEIRGRIAPQGLRRAEIAFPIPATIPPNQRQFLLRFSPGIVPVKTVDYWIDTNAPTPRLPSLAELTGATATPMPTPTPLPTETPTAIPTATLTPGEELQKASQTIDREKGFAVSDPSTYDPSQQLRVLLGHSKGPIGEYGNWAFFFLGDRYIGTDASFPSANLSFEGQNGNTITLGYGLYHSQDPLSNPSAGKAHVRFHWNGAALVPLDAVPPDDPTVDPSRR
jgi:hypothetical protein